MMTSGDGRIPRWQPWTIGSVWAGALFPAAGKTKNLTGSKTKTKETWKHLTALIHHSPRFFFPPHVPIIFVCKSGNQF